MYPPLPQRFEWHMSDRRMLNWLIQSLEVLFKETRSETALAIINQLTRFLQQGEALEEAARRAELDKAYKMLYDLPEMQRQFFISARTLNKEGSQWWPRTSATRLQLMRYCSRPRCSSR